MAVTNVRVQQDPRTPDKWRLMLDTSEDGYSSFELTVELAAQLCAVCSGWLEEESQRGMMESLGLDAQQAIDDKAPIC